MPNVPSSRVRKNASVCASSGSIAAITSAISCRVNASRTATYPLSPYARTCACVSRRNGGSLLAPLESGIARMQFVAHGCPVLLERRSSVRAIVNRSRARSCGCAGADPIRAHAPREPIGAAADTVLRQRIGSAGAGADAAITVIEVNVDRVLPRQIDGMSGSVHVVHREMADGKLRRFVRLKQQAERAHPPARASERRCDCRVPAASRTARIRRRRSTRSGRADNRNCDRSSFLPARARSTSAVRVRRAGAAATRAAADRRARAESRTSCVSTISPLPATPQRLPLANRRGDAAHAMRHRTFQLECTALRPDLMRTLIVTASASRLPASAISAARRHPRRESHAVVVGRCAPDRQAAAASQQIARRANTSCVSSPVAASKRNARSDAVTSTCDPSRTTTGAGVARPPRGVAPRPIRTRRSRPDGRRPPSPDRVSVRRRAAQQLLTGVADAVRGTSARSCGWRPARSTAASAPALPPAYRRPARSFARR